MTRRIKKIVENVQDDEVLKQDFEQLDEISDNTQVDSSSTAADTLKPGSQAVDDPKSRFEMISKMIGTLAQIDTSSLTRIYDETMKQFGTFAGSTIPNGTAAKNASTIAMKEELDTLFKDDETLTEDFRKKASTLFEAAVETKVALRVAEIEDDLVNEYNEEFNNEISEMENNVSQYIDYVAEQWLNDNQLIIENSLRNEITEEFIDGLRDLFTQHNFNIPDETVDVVESLSEKVDDLEERLSDMIKLNASLVEEKEIEIKKNIVEEVCKGLTIVEQERVRSLAENISYDDLEDYEDKLTTIKESQIIKGKRSELNEQLEEVNEDIREEDKSFVKPEMKNFVEAINRAVKKTG